METVEEFDVDISKLWKWKKEVVIKDGDEVLLKAYLRVPGDADINRARVYAIRESTKLRQKLNDKNDLDRYAYILPEELIDDEDLFNFSLTLTLRNELLNIDKEVDIPIPVKPSEDAPTEAHEKYQKEVDMWAIKRMDKIKELAEKKEKEIRERLKSLSREELYKIYEKVSADFYCDTLVGELFVDQCIFYGLYKDSKYTKRMFTNFEDFQNLPKFVKDILKEEYSNLALSMEELKK